MVDDVTVPVDGRDSSFDSGYMFRVSSVPLEGVDEETRPLFSRNAWFDSGYNLRDSSRCSCEYFPYFLREHGESDPEARSRPFGCTESATDRTSFLHLVLCAETFVLTAWYAMLP